MILRATATGGVLVEHCGMRPRRSSDTHVQWAARKGPSSGWAGTRPDDVVVWSAPLAHCSGVATYAQLSLLGWWSGEYGYPSAPGLGFTGAQLELGPGGNKMYNVQRCVEALLVLRRQLDDSHHTSILAEIDDAIEHLQF